SGEIDMEMDDTVVHLKAGDVLVQRGTIHNWVNQGTEPCVIAFILIAQMITRPSGRDALVGEWGAARCAPEFTLTAPLDAAIHTTIDHSRLRSQRLLDPRAEVRPHQVLVHVWITSRFLQLVPEFQEQPVLGPALRHLKEFSVKDRQ